MGTSGHDEPTVYRYDAFISYRHVALDREWARWLHQALETYRVPAALQKQGLPARLTRVFRDEDELPASSSLSSDIDDALLGSRFLIVVCSPRAPLSRWVNAEVERFRGLGRHDRILALLIEGEPRESFPQALCEIRRTVTDAAGAAQERVEEVEPLAADVRPRAGESARTLKRMARLRLLSCVLGCRFDDLRQREQERQARRLALAGTFFAVLFVLMGVLAVVAVRERGEAMAARAFAEQEQRRVILAGAGSALDADAYTLANQALSTVAEPHRRWPWHHLDLRSRSTGYVHTLEHIAYAPTPRPTFAGGGRVLLLDAVEGTRSEFFSVLTLEPHALGFRDANRAQGDSVHCTVKAVAGYGGHVLIEHGDGRYKVVSIPGMVEAPIEKDQASRPIGLTADGTAVFVWKEREENGKTVEVIERAPVGGKEKTRTVHSREKGERVISGAWDGPGSDDLLVMLSDFRLQRVRGERAEDVTAPGENAAGPHLVFSPDLRQIVVIDDSESVLVRPWDAQLRPIALCRGAAEGGPVRSAAWRSDGERLAVGCEDGVVRVFKVLATGLTKVHETGEHGAAVTAVAFSPDGMIAGGGMHGTIRLWDPDMGTELLSLKGHLSPVVGMVFACGGEQLVSVSRDNRVCAWMTRSPCEALEQSEEGRSVLAALSARIDAGTKSGADLASVREQARREGKLGPMARAALEQMLTARGAMAPPLASPPVAGAQLPTFDQAKAALSEPFGDAGVALLRAIRDDGLRDEPALDDKGVAVFEVREHSFAAPAETVRSITLVLDRGFESRVMIFDERESIRTRGVANSAGGVLVQTFKQDRVRERRGTFEVLAAGADRFVVRHLRHGVRAVAEERTQEWWRLEGRGARSVLALQTASMAIINMRLVRTCSSDRLNFGWLDGRPTLDLFVSHAFDGGDMGFTRLFVKTGGLRLCYDAIAPGGGRFVIDSRASDWTADELRFIDHETSEQRMLQTLGDHADLIVQMYAAGSNDQRAWLEATLSELDGTPEAVRIRTMLKIDRVNPPPLPKQSQ